MKFDTSGINSSVSAIERAANSIRDCRADGFADAVADAVDAIAEGLQEVANILEDAETAEDEKG